jgi:hypothetical protein
LITRLAEVWLFFDQSFSGDFLTALSTFLLGVGGRRQGTRKAVDKSVVKLWKDRAEGRSCWPEASLAPAR